MSNKICPRKDVYLNLRITCQLHFLRNITLNGVKNYLMSMQCEKY